MDLKQLYQDIILEHGKSPRNFGKCVGHNHAAKGHNPLCGDKLNLYLDVDTEDRIALARAYYNDSLLSLKNRLKTFPDVLVAKIFRFNPGTPLPSLTEKASEAPEISLYDDDQA